MKWIPGCMVMILLAGCKASGVSDRKVSEMRSDTLYLSQEVIMKDPLKSILVIKDLCDTITGKARDLEQIIIQGDNTAQIQIQNNQLTWTMDQVDSIKSVAVSQYRSKIQVDDKSESETIIKEITPRWIWYSLGVNVLGILGMGFWLGKKINFSWVGILNLLKFWK